MRRLGQLLALVILSAIAAVGANYFFIHRHMSAVLDGDPRNSGISMWAHYHYLVDPRTLVIDVRNVSGDNSAADVFRVLLQFAQSQQRTKYSRIVLSSKGAEKFLIDGSYFQLLGLEYGIQNPVYTMRTFPQNVYHLNGEPAFGTWTGGMLGVLGKQVEDFSQFHQQWYIEDLLGNDG
jgi:hypothetical protein